MDKDFKRIPATKANPSALVTRLQSMAADNPNEMRHWFAAVQKKAIRYPRTWFFELPFLKQLKFIEALDSGDPNCPETGKALEEAMEGVVVEIFSAVRDAGMKSAFLRTGSTSMKHAWARTCGVDDVSIDKIRQHVGTLIHDVFAEMAPPSETLALRERIPTSPVFHDFDGMPITREFRLFVCDQKGPLGHQFYWPKKAFISPNKADWADRLDAISRIDDDELALLQDDAMAVVGELGDAWSVDYLQDEQGQWWLIDMALARHSFVDRDNAVFTPAGRDAGL